MSAAHRAHGHTCIFRAAARAHCFIVSLFHCFIHLSFRNATRRSIQSAVLVAASRHHTPTRTARCPPSDPSSTRASRPSSPRVVARRPRASASRPSPRPASTSASTSASPRRDSSPPRSRSRSRRRPRRRARFRRRPSAPPTRAMGACATTRATTRQKSRLVISHREDFATDRVNDTRASSLSNARAGTITAGKISRARVNILPRVL